MKERADMYKYRNCSGITRTFYGVQFKPGEVHEVPNAIVNPYFFRVIDSNTNMESAEVELVVEPIKTDDANGLIETVKEPVVEAVEEEIEFTPAVEVEKPKSRRGRKPKNINNDEGDQ